MIFECDRHGEVLSADGRCSKCDQNTERIRAALSTEEGKRKLSQALRDALDEGHRKRFVNGPQAVPVAWLIEKHYDDEHPHIICPVEDPVAVEQEINRDGWTVGENWSHSDPAQKQADGRWKLYVQDLAGV